MQRGTSVWSQHHKRIFYNKSEYPSGSIYDFLSECSVENVNRTALEFYGSKLTYKELLSKIDSCADSLYSLGVRQGSTITIVLPNIPQAIIVFYAANKLGAVSNLLHPLLPKEDLVHSVKNTDSCLVITLYDLFVKFESLCREPECPAFILVSPSDEMGAVQKVVYRIKNKHKKIAFNNCRILSWKQLKKIAKPLSCHEKPIFQFDDTAVILYSGGTVGKPKGIELSNGNFNSLAVQLSETYYDDSMKGLRSLALMPIFHGFGLGVSIHGMLCNGSHLFPIPIYNMQYCTDLVFKKKIGILYGVPALFEAISRSVQIEKKDLSFINGIVVAGDSVSPKLMNRMNKLLKSGGSPTTMREAYGLTECTSGCCINPYFALKDGSIGLPFTDMRMAIVSPDTCDELPHGEVGEICICGPTVMKGYYKNKNDTEKVIITHKDGQKWLHTGDIGFVDEDGYYYFVQRKSNMLISSGYNIYPSVIESVIQDCNMIAESCVIGAKDAVLGQRIVLFVVPKSGFDKNSISKAIMSLCKEKLPKYSIPHEIVFSNKLPKTELGKTDTIALSDLYCKKEKQHD